MVRAGIDSVSINPYAAVFIVSLLQALNKGMLEKAPGQVKLDPNWELPDHDEE